MAVNTQVGFSNSIPSARPLTLSDRHTGQNPSKVDKSCKLEDQWKTIILQIGLYSNKPHTVAFPSTSITFRLSHSGKCACPRRALNLRTSGHPTAQGLVQQVGLQITLSTHRTCSFVFHWRGGAIHKLRFICVKSGQI